MHGQHWLFFLLSTGAREALRAFVLNSNSPAATTPHLFVLGEVNAALDNTNVAKIANYIRKHSSDAFQFIVISLKGSLYEKSNALVGIYRDQYFNSSRSMTLDVSTVAARCCTTLTRVISSLPSMAIRWAEGISKNHNLLDYNRVWLAVVCYLVQ